MVKGYLKNTFEGSTSGRNQTHVLTEKKKILWLGLLFIHSPKMDLPSNWNFRLYKAWNPKFCSTTLKCPPHEHFKSQKSIDHQHKIPFYNSIKIIKLKFIDVFIVHLMVHLNFKHFIEKLFHAFLHTCCICWM